MIEDAETLNTCTANRTHRVSDKASPVVVSYQMPRKLLFPETTSGTKICYSLTLRSFRRDLSKTTAEKKLKI